ncbi:MAG: GHKL domain-containing protein [Lachnospiraceae bacterium]|nr:GHKL domain-containing protein [Lachnospiraceae bacterium]
MGMAYSFIIFFLTLLKCGLIFKNVLHLQLSYKVKNTVLSILLYLSLSCFSGVMKNEVITYAAMTAFVVLVLMLCIDSQNKGKLFFVSVCTYLVVFCLDHFLLGIFNMTRVYMFPNLFSGVTATVISQLLSFAFWIALFILMHRNQDQYAEFFQKRYYFMFTGIVLLNDILIWISSMVMADMEDPAGVQLVSEVVVIMSIGMLIEIVIIIVNLLVREEYKDINRVNEQYLSMQRNHYEKLRQLDEDTRKYRHDMKSHLQCLKTLSELKDYDEIDHYLDNMVDKLAAVSQTITVGDPIIDAVINEKLAEAEKYRIDFAVSGKIIGSCKIEPLDLCTIFANSINNALEACMGLEEPKRKIRLSIKTLEDYLLINIKNPVKEKVLVDETGKIKTKKRDTKNHGFGIQNITASVEKYHGQVKIQCDDTEFSLEVIIKMR